MEDPAPPTTTRRDFARTAALAAVVPLIASLDACASPPRLAPQPAAAPAPVPAPAAAPAAPSASGRDPVAAALTDGLRARFPDRLTPEQWEEVRRGVEGTQAAARALHDFPLDVAVEPPVAFRPYRAGGG